nr:META domain-containing protein [uncultured Limnohabitans sp.]
MNKQLVIGALGVAVWGLVACSPLSTGHAQAWSPKALLDTHWADAGPTLGQLPASLDIASTGQISGHTGCNRYFGKADIGLHSLRWVQMGSTRMYCFQPGVMEAEDRFLQAMAQTRSARQEQGQLLLLDEAGQVLWRFKPKG